MTVLPSGEFRAPGGTVDAAPSHVLIALPLLAEIRGERQPGPTRHRLAGFRGTTTPKRQVPTHFCPSGFSKAV